MNITKIPSLKCLKCDSIRVEKVSVWADHRKLMVYCAPCRVLSDLNTQEIRKVKYRKLEKMHRLFLKDLVFE